MTSYDLKRSVIQLKTKTKPQAFALYAGEKGDQILITPKRAGPREIALIAEVLGDKPERRVRGVCMFQNDALAFKTKTKWSASLETSMIKILRREGLGKHVPPFFINAAENEVLDEEDATAAKGPMTEDQKVGEHIERLSGGNPKLTKLAEEMRTQAKALRAAGNIKEAEEKEAYMHKVVNALVRDPEVQAIAKVDPSAVEATTAAAARLPHPRGQGGAASYPPEEDFFDAFGQFRDKFRGWVRLVEKGQPQLLDLQARTDQARARYADRWAKGKKLLLEKAKSEFPRLRGAASRQPHMNSLVLETIDMPEKEKSADKRVEAAQDRVRAAFKGVGIAGIDIHMLELRDTIDSLEAKQKELQATIERNVGIAEKFISAALKGPTGIAKMLGDEIEGAAKKMAATALAGIFSEKEQKELARVNEKLSEEKRNLKKAERDRLQMALDKSKEELSAATKELYAITKDADVAKRTTDSKFSEMATLGSSLGVTTFAELKKYRAEMQALWLEYTDASGWMLGILRTAPLADAYKAANERLKTIKQAQDEHRKAGGEKTDEDALILMDMSTHYKRFADWYWGELQKYKAVGAQLGKGEHTALIDEVMQQAKKSINGE